jgi:hypothetical protein
MAEEKTLLEQVQEKEVELAAEYSRACADADARKEAAVQEGQQMIERADGLGCESATARYDGAMASLEREIEEMRRTAAERERVLSSTMENRVAEVAAELVRYVAGVP